MLSGVGGLVWGVGGGGARFGILVDPGLCGGGAVSIVLRAFGTVTKLLVLAAVIDDGGGLGCVAVVVLAGADGGGFSTSC